MLVAAALGLKAALYLIRCCRQAPPPVLLLLLRLAVGLGVPVLLWSGGWGWLHPLALAGLLVGEVVDRAQFYGEIHFLDPGLQISRDLAVLLAMD